MIRAIPRADRARHRHLAKRQWKTVFVPFAMLNVEGYGRSLVAMRRMETRWSDNHHRRLWRTLFPVPAASPSKPLQDDRPLHFLVLGVPLAILCWLALGVIMAAYGGRL